MPGKSKNKQEYLILVILGVLFIGTFLLMISFELISKDKGQNAVLRSSQSTNIDGIIIYYTLLERLGYKVKRSKQPLNSLNSGEKNVIMVLDPIIPLRSDELRELRQWIYSGGKLVTTHLPLFQEFDCYKKIALGNYSNYIKHRIREKIKDPTRIESGKPIFRKEIQQIYFETRSTFETFNEDETKKFIHEILVSDDHGARIVKFSLGRGALILITDCSFLSNGNIDKFDNAVLAVRLAAHIAGKTENKTTINFDEFHFGYGSHQSGTGVLTQMLFTTSPGWCILVLFICGILLLILKGRQFGPRFGLDKKRRRSKMEFVTSAGATLKQAGAGNLILKIIVLWFHEKLAGTLRMPLKTSNSSIAQEIAKHTGKKPENYYLILEECRQITSANRRISDSKLMSIIKKLSEIEKDLAYTK